MGLLIQISENSGNPSIYNQYFQGRARDLKTVEFSEIRLYLKMRDLRLESEIV